MWNGPLTSRLQYLKVGDQVIVKGKTTGTLVLDNLMAGRHLYLLGTGTGLAPFLSIIKDPDTYERYQKVILVHGTRATRELAYADRIATELPGHEVLGESVSQQLVNYPTVSREELRNRGRVTELITSGKLFADVALPPLDRESDRFMLCGSPDMIRDTRKLLSEAGLVERNHGEAGHCVIEKVFIDK